MCIQLKQNKNVNVCLKMNCAFIISITLFLQLIVLHRKLAQGLNYCSPQNFHSVWRTENKLQHLSDMPFFVFVSGILSCSLSWNRHHLAELPWVDFWLGLFWSGCRLRKKNSMVNFSTPESGSYGDCAMDTWCWCSFPAKWILPALLTLPGDLCMPPLLAHSFT